jgi:propanol-preferring alcohol dehydrogenase
MASCPAVTPPVIPGHEIVGIVDAVGEGVTAVAIGERVGLPWLGPTCGVCRYCAMGAENLCDTPQFTRYTRPGGFASQVVADAGYCIPLNNESNPVAAVPLQCAGLFGRRCLTKAGEASVLGLYGFGAAAHMVTQIARWQGRRVFEFTRPGDVEGQAFARSVGAMWAGSSAERPPEWLDAAIVFAPDGGLVPLALQAVRKGGRVVCGGIHMSQIPAFPYRLLREERQLLSVANLAREDAKAFFAIAPRASVITTTMAYPLDRANDALSDLRHGHIHGAAVLTCQPVR